MVQKYGIEGLLAVTGDIEMSDKTQVQVNVDKEEAYLPNCATPLKVFDKVRVQIVAKTVEFRRQVLLVYAPKK